MCVSFLERFAHVLNNESVILLCPLVPKAIVLGCVEKPSTALQFCQPAHCEALMLACLTSNIEAAFAFSPRRAWGQPLPQPSLERGQTQVEMTYLAL